MSAQDTTKPETPPHGEPPQANGSAHPKSPDGPASPEHGDERNQDGDGRTRHNSKQLGPVTTGDLRDKLMDKKEQLKQKSKPPGGYDPTPLPDAPQGYTVKITFHRAYNLPIGDLHIKSSDPFIHATLTAAVPKRHKEDPLLTHRTRTIRRSTEPVWNEDWIVANVPESGFTLKCRLYDEDWPDHDDRLGNVTIRVPHVDETWEGFGPDGRVFDVKKRSGSKRAYMVRGVLSMCGSGSITPRLHIGIQVLGKSDPPHAQMYTVGPSTWVKHYSPMIGRLTGVRVNKDEENDAASTSQHSDRKTKKYDFQANELQLSGPVPEQLYHRYVEFRPMIGRMFMSRGIRGTILHKVLHKQHSRIYNYDSGTEYGSFEPCTEEASLQFLRMVHFDEGGRVFTYVLTLDGMMRFTETGKEFGIDLLSKHTMHSDVATYVACAGEFFIRRLARPKHHHHHRSKGSSSHRQDFEQDDHDTGPSSFPKHETKEDEHSAGPSSSPNHESNPFDNGSQPSPSSSYPNHTQDHNPNPTNDDDGHGHNNPPKNDHNNGHDDRDGQDGQDGQGDHNDHDKNNKNKDNDPLPYPTNPDHSQPTHPPSSPPGGPPSKPPPPNPHLYQLIIDNDSGTYRPDKSVLPHLQSFLSRNFPGIEVITMHCADEQLSDMKKAQAETKKREGAGVRMVLNRSPSNSSGFSSDDESRLGALDAEGGLRSKKERVFDVVSGGPGGEGWRGLVGLVKGDGGMGKGKGKEGEGG